MANFCENCGSPLKIDNKFCPNCGAPVKQTEPEVPITPVTPNSFPKMLHRIHLRQMPRPLTLPQLSLHPEPLPL
jgi:predicted amidophosphoribosyltransferase